MVGTGHQALKCRLPSCSGSSLGTWKASSPGLLFGAAAGLLDNFIICVLYRTV
jgi:hypothetical protein